MRLNNKKKSIIEVTLLLLFTFVLITTQMVTNIFAKYRTNNKSVDGSNVASFNIDINITDSNTSVNITEILDYEIIPGDKIILDINLDSTKSEVKVKYNIKIETLDNLPLDITYNGIDIKTSGISGTINVSESVSLDDIIIEWESTEANRSFIYSGEVDLIKIIIEAEQVD